MLEFVMNYLPESILLFRRAIRPGNQSVWWCET